MRFLLKLIFWLVILGIIAVLAIILVPAHRSRPIAQLPENYQSAEGRGQYMAIMADCAACHTGNSAQPFAGGKPIDSPFGKIYASNITPGKRYGIGNYSLEDFSAALRDGLRPDGSHLYPAMPYDSYRKLTDEDIVALYDYFMHNVQPVEQPVQKTALVFPFNQRWGIRLWNWLVLRPETGFTPPYNNAKLDRGAYIVEGPGHCGACHTPRDIIFRQKGFDASSPLYLTGSAVGGWSAPDLRGANSALAGWTDDDLKFYLTTGRNHYSSAAGPMNFAIRESLQYLKSEDIDAIVAYLQHIQTKAGPQQPVRDAGSTIAMLTKAEPSMPLGARLYLDNCGACHFVNGLGAPEVFPRLDGAAIVNAEDAAGLIYVILQGSRLPSTALRPEDLAMPGFAWRLSDEEVSELVNFLRTAWTNNAAPVTAEKVAKIRAQPYVD
ncbi:MAG: cytochrome c [Candidatus Tokpelaia sp.]|uniref:cytochrome c n=1 Tax=Candidatus Tokpelaia sp. TaxID=2233777 RepID=UPI00123A4128|nr:cytochrome c [Candidatus Tokpelaia sp.]KAA6206260.1 MAG: cytochrome c [Candidatus Tokpelaia sp.]KAA6206332.1 MAG: cytochrome c [Candidatus Tokpelaia sp.]KAA6406308.1 cytochrome c [Candidatus Tokpelaia sp.]